jgi:hypothetical protein
MQRCLRVLLVLFALLFLGWIVWEQAIARLPARILVTSLMQLANMVEPAAETAPRTLATRVKIVKAEGLSSDLAGRTVELAFQEPDRLRVSRLDSRARRPAGAPRLLESQRNRLGV